VIDARYLSFLVLGALDAAGYGIIGPAIPSVAETTGASISTAGLLVGTFGVGMVIAFWPSGVAIQRLGARPVAVASLGLIALGTIPLVATESLGPYFAARLVMGLGSGGLWSAICLGVIERWPGEEYKRLSGVIAIYSVGGIAGPALGSIGGVRGPFLAYLGVVLAGFAAIRLIGPPSRHAPRFGSDRRVLRLPEYAVSATLVVLVALTVGTLDGVLPLHFASELSQVGIGVLFMGTSVVVAASAVLAARLPLRAAGAASVGIVVAGLAAAGLTGELWAWIVALALTGFGFGLADTVSVGYLLEAASAERLIAATIVWNQMFAIGYLVGPSIGGAVADAFGFGAIGLVPLAMGLLVLAAIARLPRAREATSQEA
jgi:MFS family permease